MPLPDGGLIVPSDEGADEIAKAPREPAAIVPSDEGADEVVAGQRAGLRAALRHGVTQDPQAVAKQRSLAAATGLPPDVVQRNPDAAARAARLAAIDTAAIERDHPVLARYLSDPGNASLSHDDIPVLQRLDRAMRQLRAGPDEDVLGILPSGFQFDGRGRVLEPTADGKQARVYDTIDEMLAELRRRADVAATQATAREEEAAALAASSPVPNLAAGMHASVSATREALGTQTSEGRINTARIGQASADLDPSWVGDLKRGVGGVVADLPLMLAGGPLGTATGSLLKLSRAKAILAPLGERGASAASTSLKTAAAVQPLALREGAADAEAHGASFGGVSWAIETVIPGAFGRTGVERALIPDPATMAKTGPRGWIGAARFAGMQTGLELTEEATTELAHALHEYATGVDPSALEPGRLGRRLFVAGALGGLAGGAFNLPAAVGQKLERDALAIRQSEREASALAAAFDASRESLTGQRDPDALAQLLAAVEEQSGVRAGTVYMQGEAWDAHWRARGEDPAAAAVRMGADPTAYAAARAAGAQVALPAARFLAQASPEDRALLDHASLRAEGMTPAELGGATEAMRAQVEQGVAAEAQAAVADPAEASADLVAERVEADLVAAGTEAGAARAQAQVLRQGMLHLARRAGIDPMALFERYGLRIQRERPEVLRNGERVDTLDALIGRLAKGDVPTERDVRGPSLVEFLRSKGGVRDDASNGANLGDLRRLELDKGGMRKPGERALVSPEGMFLDAAVEAALEAGYELPSPDINGLVDALTGEAGGAPVYREGIADPELGAIRDALEEMRAVLAQAGVDPVRASAADVRRVLMQPQGQELEQPAYHGSPHRFDRFTTAAMSTGEGAQAYGWGLYFAGRKQVAEYYRETLAKIRNNGPLPEPVKQAFRAMDNLGFDSPAEAFNAVRTEKDWAQKWDASPAEAAVIDEHIRATAGRVYTVEIPEDKEFLLWDRPLADHPAEVQAAVRALYAEHGMPDPMAAATPKMGESVYLQLAWKMKPNPADPTSLRAAMKTGGEAASKALKAAGVPGIKFLDGGSRADGDGTYNYVIFDDADVRITEYEQPGKDRAPRGKLTIGPGRTLSITLLAKADLSTALHEMGHAYLEILTDLAGDAQAAEDLKADLATIRAWVGNDGGAWTTDQHEQFARGFEAYLMEGKAPSTALRGAFARFRGWLTAIYRTIAGLRVTLTPEVRSVFDRMLASEREIDVAAERLGAAPVFASAEEMGLTEAGYTAYRKALEDARAQAADQVRTELMRVELAAVKQAREAEFKDVLADITAEVNGRREFAALRALQDGVMPSGATLPAGVVLKLDRGDLVRQYGEDALKRLPGPRRKGEAQRPNTGRRVYANEGGLGLQEAARLLGYPTGDALWEALVNAPDRKQTIVAEAKAEMARRHPDPLTDGSIAESATAALAGELAGEVVVAEVRALASRTGDRVAPTEVLREAARSIVDATRARDIRPEVYQRAAAAAAREAFEAAARARGAAPEQRADLDRAIFQAKQRELFNLHLFRAARDAKADGERGQEYLRRFDTLDARQRLGKAGGWEWTVYGPTVPGEAAPVLGVFADEAEARAAAQATPGATFDRTNGYLEQIDGLLEGYQLRRVSTRALRRRESLSAWVARQREAGEPVDLPDHVVADLGSRNWRDLTVAEQRDLVAAVENIEHLARVKNRLLKSSRERTLEAARTAIVGTIEEHATRHVDRRIGTTGTESLVDRYHRFLEAHRKDAFLAREMDGGKDAGTVWSYLIRPRTEAANAEAEMLAAAAKQRDADYQAWRKRAGVLRQDIPGTRLRLTAEQRIAMACNWGNPEGRQRVLQYVRAAGSNERDVLAVIDSLDPNDWALVKATWKQLDGYWSEIKALEQRTAGLAPEKVEALPIPTRYGEMPGGYYPLKYDQRLSNKAGDLQAAAEAKERLRASIGSPQTRRGHTKQRSQQVEGLALRLDFGVVGEHVSEVIHDLTHREMLIDQNRLLRDKTIAGAMIDRYGRGALDQFVNTAADIAVGDRAGRAAIDPYVRMLRQNASAAAFGFNLTTAAVNVTGLLQAIPRVGVARMLGAVARIGGGVVSQEATITWVQERSSFMRTRSQTMLREMAESNRRVDATGALDDIKRWGYVPLTFVQRCVDTVTWVAAYDRAMADLSAAGKPVKEAEAEAVAVADQTVIDTQGSGRVGDLAAIQRGGELAKLFTTFYSFFNVTYNLQREAVRGAVDRGEWMRLATTTLCVWILPAWLGSRIGEWLRGDDTDDEDRWQRLALEQASFGAGMIVGVRELSGVLGPFAGSGYGGPAGLRGLDAMFKLARQTMQMEPDAGLAKAMAGGAGIFGLPAVEAQRLIDAWLIAQEGEGWPAMRAALFGKPRTQ